MPFFRFFNDESFSFHFWTRLKCFFVHHLGLSANLSLVNFACFVFPLSLSLPTTLYSNEKPTITISTWQVFKTCQVEIVIAGICLIVNFFSCTLSAQDAREDFTFFKAPSITKLTFLKLAESPE